MSAVDNVVAIDIGGDTLKAGRVGSRGGRGPPPIVVPNCTATLKFTQKFVADQITAVPNQKGFNYKRSLERGYLVNTATQCEVLHRVFTSRADGGLGVEEDAEGGGGRGVGVGRVVDCYSQRQPN